MNYSPVAFFAFKRPYHTSRSLNSLSLNNEAKNTDLYVFIDGPRKSSEVHLIDNVEKIIQSFSTKFKSIRIKRSDKNLSIATSVYKGVNEVLNFSETVILLEDDVTVSEYFLSYMNTALDKYHDKKEIWHINSFIYPIKIKGNFDCFFIKPALAYGFGTWKDRWNNFISHPYSRDPNYLKEIFTTKMRKELDLNVKRGIFWNQIEYNLRGNTTWAIFWYCHIFLNNGLCLTPKISLSKNIGYDGSGDRTGYNGEMLSTILNQNKIKNFPNIIKENTYCRDLLKKYIHNKNTIFIVIYRTIKVILNNFKKIFLR